MTLRPKKAELPAPLALFEQLLHRRAGEFRLGNRQITVFLPGGIANVDATVTHETIHKYVFEMTSSGNLLLVLAALFEQPKVLGCSNIRKARRFYLWMIGKSYLPHEAIASFGEFKYTEVSLGRAEAVALRGRFRDDYREQCERMENALDAMAPLGLNNTTFGVMLGQAALNLPLPPAFTTYATFRGTTKRKLMASLVHDPEARFEQLLAAIRDGSMVTAIKNMGGLEFDFRNSAQLNAAAEKFFSYVNDKLFPICGGGKISELDRIRHECLESWHMELSKLGFGGLSDLIRFDVRQSSANYTRVTFDPVFASNRHIVIDSLFTPDDFAETCSQYLEHPMLAHPRPYVHLGMPQRGGVKVFAGRVNPEDREMVCVFTPADREFGAAHPNVLPFAFRISIDIRQSFVPIFQKYRCLVTTTVNEDQEFKDLSLAGIHGRPYFEHLETMIQLYSGQPIVYDGQPPARPLRDLADSGLVTFHRLVNCGVEVLLARIESLANWTEVNVLAIRIGELNFPFVFIRPTPSQLVPPTSRTIFYCPSDGYSVLLLQDVVARISSGSLPTKYKHTVKVHDSLQSFGVDAEDIELVTTHFIYYGW